MQAEIEEVLLLQEEWTPGNTDAMRRRGIVIRQTLPQKIEALLPALRGVHPILTDVAVEGRDGTGLKTEIPWTRVYSISRSPSATQGWYIVYLFSAFGDRLYLSLNQGTTRWEAGEFKPRPPEELSARVAWARNRLSLSDRSGAFDISLEARRSNLGRQYELGNVVSFVYESNSIPGDGELQADLRTMVEWLAAVYAAEESSFQVPGEPPAEVADALVAIRQSAGSGRRTGQGYRLNTAEKLAIERHAVSAATRHFRDQGFTVRDVGATHPYDLDVKRGDEHLSVEVKGTTSPGAEVILTYGEVNHHRRHFPSNALVVVHSIQLDRYQDPPTASGGQLSVTSPWHIDEGDLTPIAYTYSTGLSGMGPATSSK